MQSNDMQFFDKIIYIGHSNESHEKDSGAD